MWPQIRQFCPLRLKSTFEWSWDVWISGTRSSSLQGKDYFRCFYKMCFLYPQHGFFRTVSNCDFISAWSVIQSRGNDALSYFSPSYVCRFTSSGSSWCSLCCTFSIRQNSSGFVFEQELFLIGKMIFCFSFFLSRLRPTVHVTVDISCHGYRQCQFSGAAGLNPGYQSGHSCAEARRGAASAVGDSVGLLLGPSGKAGNDRNINHSQNLRGEGV